MIIRRDVFGRGVCAAGLSLALAAGWPHQALAEQASPAATAAPALMAAPEVSKAAPQVPAPPQRASTKLAATQPPPTRAALTQVVPASAARVAALEPAPARLGPGEPSPAKTATTRPQVADSLTPARLFSGPSIYETGRVGKMAVSGAQIPKTHVEHGMLREASVQQAAPREDVPAPPPPGVINQAVLGREIRSRFAALESCRAEVSRHGKIAPITGARHRLLLRWTILPNGRITDATVVATARVNLRVMDCVKRHMSVWSFSPPRGGVVRVERPLTFRPPR